MEELTISLLISDRSYRLAVEREHEELFRKAAKLIDQRLHDYSASYAYKDKQDLLAMVALEFTTKHLQDEQMLTGKERYLESKLAEIDNDLDLFFRRYGHNVL